MEGEVLVVEEGQNPKAWVEVVVLPSVVMQ